MAEIVVFRVTGISPLLQNNPAGMRGGVDAKKMGTKKIPTPEEEAAAKVYQNEDGYYIPSQAFRSAIIGRGGAGSGLKIGKMTANARASAGMFTIEPFATLLDPEKWKPLKEYEIHTCRAVVQRQGVLRSRPMFPKWGTRVPMEIDDEFIAVDQVIGLMERAGKVAGVGDFRPQTKGTFGRFTVEIEN